MAAISIHALLAESDSKGTLTAWIAKDFYPRSPCGERRAAIRFFALVTIISIHALLAESDRERAGKQQTGGKNFYPRSPCGERPHLPAFAGCLPSISIHALLAESDHEIDRKRAYLEISIHALLAESDFFRAL